MANTILNFHFDYRHPSIRHNLNMDLRNAHWVSGYDRERKAQTNGFKFNSLTLVVVRKALKV